MSHTDLGAGDSAVNLKKNKVPAFTDLLILLNIFIQLIANGNFY